MATNQFVDFKVVKDQVSIEKAVSLLGLAMRKHGDSMRSACPTCKQGGDRALAVNLNKNAYFCFAQGKGGDVIAFASHVRNVSARDAALFLSGGTIHSSDRAPAPTSAASSREPNESRVLKPLDYLQYTAAVEGLGVSQATCEHFGAGYAGKGIMRGRFAVPIHGKDGTLLAYVGIAVEAEQSPRLHFPNGFDPHSVIFNANRVGAGELYLVRDPLQVLTAFESGVENVVAFLAPITPQSLEMLASLCDEQKVETIELF